MTSSNRGRLTTATGLIILCATASCDTTAGPTTGAVQDEENPLSLPLKEIPGVSDGGKLVTACNIAANKPASKVVRLHLGKDLFNNLENSYANSGLDEDGDPIDTSLIDVTNSSTACSGGATSCLDSEAPTAFPPLLSPIEYKNPGDTRLDIDLRKQWGAGPTYAPILVEIVLDDDHLSFMNNNKNDPTDSSIAVQTDTFTATNYGTMMFDCRQPIGMTLVNPPRPEVAFRVKRWSNSETAVGHLNIGVIVREQSCAASPCTGFSIPIILDPQVPNRG